ncbi:hypothetical protein ATE84_4338 [Aquimarina sp. MAR_2010_214]|uniref:hypothetical protein n=1 Tax=Aquimarina sp. MAR_2010_214 TaxID=1250026 RepID=UPI000C706575|nr:hypothetical protein [Aquimarina sp. MAR_2010_214]PKV52231.1 hypothetical protein ATE84_4338 [Aquimarina sp. MAR_2010_214]
MRNTNGQNVCLNDNLLKTVNDSVEPKVSTSLNSSEAEFLDYIKFHGISEFVKSLKMIHDFALYHTDLCFDKDEKSALYNLKILWEGMEQITKS